MPIFNFFKKKPSSEQIARTQAEMRLPEMSKRVLNEMRTFQKSHRSSDRQAALQLLISKGYATSKQAEPLLEQCITLLKNSPIISNIPAHLFALDGFTNSEAYRSGWAVKTAKTTTYWNTRQKVEEQAFGYTIDWGVKIKDAALARPTYAAVNYVNHPFGAATAYGSVIANWMPSTRWRCTYTDKDTFETKFGFNSDDKEKIKAGKKMICTADQFETLIANLGKTQIQALVEKVKGTYEFGDYPPNYIEAQVHGPLEWGEDLNEIWVANTAQLKSEAKQANKSVEDLLGNIKTFASRYQATAVLLELDQKQPRIAKVLAGDEQTVLASYRGIFQG